jgi:hypothetical protein
MQTNMNFVRAKLATTDLLESIICLQAGARFPEIYREAIEDHLTDLARELGFTVSPITALDTARLADDVAAMAPLRALEAAE